MEIRSYNAELSYANLLFKKLFDNIVIERKSKSESKQIPVTCVIGNRSRIIKNLENSDKQGIYKLPIIIITRTGIQRNAGRLANLHNEVLHQTSSRQIIYDLYAPVPIDVSYSVTIISKYPGDNDMIVSNFLPFFNSDLFVSCKHPKFTDLKFNSQIIMSDNISEDHPEEISPTDDDLITTTLNFTFKTYIFAGTQRVASNSSGGSGTGPGEDGDISSDYTGFIPSIHKINLDIHAVPRHDITYPRISTITSTDIKIEDGTEISTVIEITKYIPIPKTEYSFNNYFTDFDNDKFPNKEIYFDELRWSIDESGVLTNTLSKNNASSN